ncbi:MAG: YbaB/EbfC family nucleoid-associated protein [Christensenellaceae bacterium]|jgi:DNA-binding YbaB/EbfC family protein|nr:YbaB/EbfC family nucleoid-associated protein [Christensenellaceae bacterium]
MGKFNGFGGAGGMGNLGSMMQQAKKLQEDMAKAKEELSETEAVGTAGGDLVEVVISCDYKISSVKIKPEAVDPDDVETLEDLITVAIADALKTIAEERDNALGQFGGVM